MIGKTILIFLVSVIGNAHWFTGDSLIQQPIIVGTLTGLVMGDLQAGLIMGATLELAFVGAVSIGAYDPPDMIAGTILGVAFAIQAGAGPEAALTLGIPIATINLMVHTVVETPGMIYLSHKCDKYAESGNYKGIEKCALWGPWIVYLIPIIVVPVAFYFGSDVVVSALDGIPEFVQTGMDIACGIIPAVGFAMLAQMIMNKKVAPFFFVGYFLVQYSLLTTTGVALFAALIAMIYYFNVNKNSNPETESVSGGDFDEF